MLPVWIILWCWILVTDSNSSLKSTLQFSLCACLLRRAVCSAFACVWMCVWPIFWYFRFECMLVIDQDSGILHTENMIIYLIFFFMQKACCTCSHPVTEESAAPNLCKWWILEVETSAMMCNFLNDVSVHLFLVVHLS